MGLARVTRLTWKCKASQATFVHRHAIKDSVRLMYLQALLLSRNVCFRTLVDQGIVPLFVLQIEIVTRPAVRLAKALGALVCALTQKLRIPTHALLLCIQETPL